MIKVFTINKGRQVKAGPVRINICKYSYGIGFQRVAGYWRLDLGHVAVYYQAKFLSNMDALQRVKYIASRSGQLIGE